MCGIAGIFSLEAKKIPFSNVKRMLKQMKNYGASATGVVAYSNNGIYELKKDNIASDLFVEKYEIDLKRILDQDLNAVILHTRQPTAGNNGIRNAQPIENKNGVVAHNGSVYNIEEMCKHFNVKFAKKKSDTYLLSKMLEENKINEVLGLANGTVKLFYLLPNTSEFLMFNNATQTLDMSYDKKKELLIAANYEIVIDYFYKEYKYYFGGLFKESNDESAYKDHSITDDIRNNEAVRIDFNEGIVEQFDIPEMDLADDKFYSSAEEEAKAEAEYMKTAGKYEKGKTYPVKWCNGFDEADERWAE